MTAVEDNIIVLYEGLDQSKFVIATYLLQGPEAEDMLSRMISIAMEQTVGSSSYQIEGLRHLCDLYGGKLVGFFSVPDHESRSSQFGNKWKSYVVRIAYPVENTGYQIPMLLTMAIGDISLGGMIKLLDLDLPTSFVDSFQGPKFGLDGIREMLGGVKRSLVCTILKPCIGVDSKTAGEIFYLHAVGGADMIKDDELMVYLDDEKIEDRVRACISAEKRAFDETGEHTIYWVSITDTPMRMIEKAKRAIEAGANGLMLTPLTTGLSSMQMLAEDKDIVVPLFGHPAMLGAMSWSPDYGVSEHVLQGKLLRLAGADMNAIPVPYGRFTHLREQFLRLFNIAKSPMRNIKPMLTQSGGGLNPINAKNVLEDLGNDIVLVAGGSIQKHPRGLTAGIRAFRQAIEIYNNKLSQEEAKEKYVEYAEALHLWGN